jgi:hypothetical protein
MKIQIKNLNNILKLMIDMSKNNIFGYQIGRNIFKLKNALNEIQKEKNEISNLYIQKNNNKIVHYAYYLNDNKTLLIPLKEDNKFVVFEEEKHKEKYIKYEINPELLIAYDEAMMKFRESVYEIELITFSEIELIEASNQKLINGDSISKLYEYNLVNV